MKTLKLELEGRGYKADAARKAARMYAYQIACISKMESKRILDATSAFQIEALKKEEGK